jgi:hypothetical protein
MNSLHDMQTMVRDAVFETAQDGSALQAVSKHIKSSPGIAAAEHLLIYRRAILGTLISALGNIYPVCKRLVGEQFFTGMARKYIRLTPSQSPDLANYGASFAEFIASFKPAAELAYLPDVAILEWHWHRAFHAADEAGIDFAALRAASERNMSGIVFMLPVSASLIASDYPVHRIWQVNQEDWDGDKHIDLNQGGVHLIVWRRKHEMRIDEVDMQSWKLLSAIDAGMSLGEFSTSMDAYDLDALLPGCVRQGWIGSFK